MNGPVIRRYAFALLIAVAGVAFGVAGDARAGEPGFSGADGRGLAERNADRDLKVKIAATVEAADRDLAARGLQEPDAQYVLKLQSALPQPSADDPRLVSEPEFQKNLRALFLAQSQPSVGSNRDDGRVIGGAPAPKSTDVVAVIEVRNGNQQRLICSGTLVGRRVVLTAAHCVCGAVGRLYVQSDEHIFTGQGKTWWPVTPHLLEGRDFCWASGASSDEKVEAIRGRDLAVLVADTDIASGNARRPRSLLGLAAYANWQANFVRTVGYGFSRYDPSGTPIGAGDRLYADLAVAAAKCTPAAAAKFHCQAPELVAQGRAPHWVGGLEPDTCNIDSGGPIYAMVGTPGQAAEFYTVGVTSRGLSNRCGSGTIFAVSSRPDALSWLKDLHAQIFGND